jgi:hypothetical protein
LGALHGIYFLLWLRREATEEGDVVFVRLHLAQELVALGQEVLLDPLAHVEEGRLFRALLNYQSVAAILLSIVSRSISRQQSSNSIKSN